MPKPKDQKKLAFYKRCRKQGKTNEQAAVLWQQKKDASVSK